jgi:3-deoxy-manno-octulosonate cytidylyltransferase (CMP-KDO synthetase)
VPVATVIPARLKSQRLPGKPLQKIAGVPMILRVIERVRRCRALDPIIVATDSPEIYDVVRASGGDVQMTSADHRSGSDRVAEVAARLPHPFILNVQGDEPLLPLSTLERIVQCAAEIPFLQVATAMVAIRDESEIVDPNVVKVVSDGSGKALYFSRCPIPYRREAPPATTAARVQAHSCAGYCKHIGIYLFRRDFLLEFVRWPATPLETSESLEQLRILERGHTIHVVEVPEDSPSVDTPEDLARVEALVQSEGRQF